MIRTEAPGRGRVVAALGVVQILAWGSSYYLLAVLAAPIARHTGWSYPLVVGGVSVGLMAAALVSIRVGRAIERHGGRPVLAGAVVLLALGLGLLATAPGPAVYLLAWGVVGVGMGAGLYDAAFATLGRIYGLDARRAITTLTLWGGFASTVCWPLSAWLVETVGWRGACLAYAGLHLAFTLPLSFSASRRRQRGNWPARRCNRTPPPARRPGPPSSRCSPRSSPPRPSSPRSCSVHLIAILDARGMTLAAAVALGALVGPAQVGARVVEFATGGRHHTIWTLATAALLIAAGMILLWRDTSAPAVALFAYGAGNGLWSIGRGALPLALFGAQGYATLMGRLAVPSLAAQAAAPTVGALLLTRLGVETTLAALAMLALVNLAAIGLLWRLSGIRPAKA